MDESTSTNTGIVLDVLRGSVHDGPGIRTTEFLKGCPLRCLWCHNPESQRAEIELSFDASRCTACGACRQACAHEVHRFEAGQHTVNRSLCVHCGKCVAACPANALQLKGVRMTVADVMAEVVSDRAYYEATGGGLTLSGGEPMAQYQFARALLVEAKRLGIHTAIETCGYASAACFTEILPLVDVFLFDYKGTDEALHVEHTGVSNKRILDNFERLYRSGAKILLRCPLVAGLNDTEDHLRGIAQISRNHLDLIGVELMPYHRMGIEKGVRVGMAPRFDQEGTSYEQREQWNRQLRERGCTPLGHDPAAGPDEIR